MSNHNVDVIQNQVKEEIFDSVRRGFECKNSVIRIQKKQISQIESQLKASELKFANFVQELEKCLTEFGKTYLDALTLKIAIEKCIQNFTSSSSNPVLDQTSTKSSVTITVTKANYQPASRTHNNTTNDSKFLELFARQSNGLLKVPQILLQRCDMKSYAFKDHNQKGAKETVDLTNEIFLNTSTLTTGKLKPDKKNTKQKKNKSMRTMIKTPEPLKTDPLKTMIKAQPEPTKEMVNAKSEPMEINMKVNMTPERMILAQSKSKALMIEVQPLKNEGIPVSAHFGQKSDSVNLGKPTTPKPEQKAVKIKDEIDFAEIEKILNEHKEFLSKSSLNDSSYHDDKKEENNLKRKSWNSVDDDGDGTLFDDPPTIKHFKMTKPELTTLPTAILAKILNYIPSCDLLNTICTVSKQFNQLINSPQVRLTIKIGRGVKPHDAVDLFTKRCQQIEEIIFSQANAATVKKLSLEMNQLSNLRSIQYQFLRSKLLPEVFIGISKLPHLVRIKISDIPDGSGLQNLAQCQNIQHATISMYNLSQTEYNGIASLGKLKSLNLDLSSRENKIDPKAITEGHPFSSLLYLSLILDSATDSHLKAVASHFPNLVRLSIRDKSGYPTTLLTLSEIKNLMDQCNQLQYISLTIRGLENFRDLQPRIGHFDFSFEKDSMILRKSANITAN